MSKKPASQFEDNKAWFPLAMKLPWKYDFKYAIDNNKAF